jgi:hypothetical protein
MLKVNKKALNKMESNYPGIGKTITFFERANVPSCPHCGSEDTANVGCGLVGRSIHIAGATTKFKLIPNGPKPGEYFCNPCEKFFN